MHPYIDSAFRLLAEVRGARMVDIKPSGGEGAGAK